MTVRSSLYKFQESRFTSLSHELRVYISGADVTPWLKGDLSVTYGNRDSFNSVTFELGNPRRLWQITRDNLEGKWRKDIGEYSELEKLKVFRWKNSTLMNPSFNLNINTQILGQKDTTGAGDSNTPGPMEFTPPLEGTEKRYRLAINDCIFSRQDPMRVFLRNPYSSNQEWVEIFCGFVGSHPITTNHLTGESTVRISGYCIRDLLKKMRVQLNILVVSADNQPLFDRGFFSDFLKPSYGKHPFNKSTLEATIKALILGTESPTAGEAAGVTGGLGDFKMGNVVCYDAASPGTTLERWHLMTLFGVNKVPFPNGADDDLWLNAKEMDDMGRATLNLPDTFAQGPGGRYLHFLLPKGGTGAGALIQSSLDSSGFRAVEWTTRWEIIRDFASKLDFQVLTSPSGDILVEFPLYGFTPHVFSAGGAEKSNQYYDPNSTVPDMAGVQELNATIEKANEAAVNQVNQDISDGTVPRGLGALLTFELHQLEETLNDEAEDFPTILQVDGGMSFEKAQVNSGGEYSSLRAFVYSPVLVGRFGAIMEQMQIPFAGQRSADMSSADGNAAANSPIAKRMSKLALIEYMKRLADASTWDGSVIYRPFLFPNRPVWLKRSARIGLLTSVTNRWSIGKSAATNFSLHMLMSERYGENKTEYRLPTGAANMPIDYRNIWGEELDGSETSGVFVTVGTKTPPTSAANGTPGSVGSGTPAPSNTSKSPFSLAQSDKLIPYNDSKYMYKPFSDAITAALDLAKKENFPAITITSTYRDPQKQLYLQQHPEARAKKANGDPVECAEPWKSCHQYGMAIDIKIAGNRWTDYQRFAALCGETVKWGAAYSNDYVHYEWNSPGLKGTSGKTSLLANKFRKVAGFGDTDASTMTAAEQRQAAAASGSGSGSAAAAKGSYLEAVWKQFMNMEQRVNIPEATPPSFVDKIIAFITPSESTGTGDATTGPPCAPSYLQKPGMADIKEVAAEIASATSGA